MVYLSCVIEVKDATLIYNTLRSMSLKRIFNKNTLGNSFVSSYKALDNLSFSLEKGKVYGIIGNNGAGKSTLLRLLAGIMTPNTGQVIRHCQKVNLLALGIGFSSELTGRQNIYLNSMLLGFSEYEISQKLDSILEFSGLVDFIDTPMKTYSSGMVSRLGFSIAINMKPDVLLIDEVLSVGDNHFKEKSYKAIKELIFDRNITVVLVSHSLGNIESLCEEAIWLDKGKVVDFDIAINTLSKYKHSLKK